MAALMIQLTGNYASVLWQSFVRSFHIGPSRVKRHRRKAPGVGVYAGQISNFDTNDLNFHPVTVPDIPLNQVGTDYVPSKLFMIWRTKPLKGRPYWERNIIRDFGLDDERYAIQIVKNCPRTNQKLYHVKHLIRIKPITFPDGIPTEEDIGNTILKPDGQLVIRKSLRMTPAEILQEKPLDPKKMDRKTLEKHLRLRWLNAYHV